MAGRPRANIDPEKVELLAGCGCTVEEIAAKLGCNASTLYRNFARHIEKGRETGRASLRGKQFEVAMRGNVPMLIWLGKQMLGQAEKVDVAKLTDAQLVALLTAGAGEGSDEARDLVPAGNGKHE